MPLITDTRLVGIAATVANIVAGSRFEFPPAGRATSIIGGIVSALPLVTCTFSVGDRIIVEDYPVPVESAVGVVAVDRDFNLRAVAKPGERIVVSVTNGNAAAAQITLLLNLN